MRGVVQSIFIISVGASLGTTLRWFLGVSLNALFPAIPLGTLASNLIGGYLVGIMLAIFVQYPGFSPEWRLLIVTGFLGGLTTFSTFSAEIVTLMQQNRLGLAGTAVLTHVLGSLAMTLLGVLTAAILLRKIWS